ncbi:putative sensor histidine kinase [hydrothermal vent metagenome]|uniref:Putative sensor histidine kinase n=1 Tax=hydrothermal vent metagenome TaxID=652676 RepID=A0A1W1CEA9_9ZZZZ
MKYVETESFTKSFFLFFISIGTLLAVVFYLNYQKELQSFDEKLLYKMNLCSYSLDCKEFKIDFDREKGKVCYLLFKDNKEIYSFYPLPEGSDSCLKLSMTSEAYHNQIHYLHKDLIRNGLISLVAVFFLSVLFSFYTLYPLRNALFITREFIKDILHDFNTPIATMRLNLSLLKKEIGANKKISRIERSIENILALEENLRDYLHFEASQKEQFNLLELIEERVHMIEQNYPNLSYEIKIDEHIELDTFKKDFVRIVDNIIVNASKYNKPQGSVLVAYDVKGYNLTIKDTGKGIKNPKKIFKRFYKEHERGLGIGLHIVKKLIDVLGIKIEVNTVVEQGTTIILKLKKIVSNK